MIERELVSLPDYKTEASNELAILSEQEVLPSEQAFVPKTKFMSLTTLSGKQEVLPSERAFERISDAVKLNLHQLQRNMDKARSESSRFSWVSMVFCAMASSIMLGGIGLMWAGLVKVGFITTAASIIPSLGAHLVFSEGKELRKTMETYHSHIMESQRVLTMIDLAETIGDVAVKDSVKEQIVRAVLVVDPPSERRGGAAPRIKFPLPSRLGSH
jgi:hypothetical protein